MQGNGDPWQYAQVGTQHIVIYRKPSSGGTILELQCICIPAEYTQSSDEVKIRSTYERAVVYFAVGEFYASRGDAARAGDYHKRYLEAANLMKMTPDQPERAYQYQPPWRRNAAQQTTS